MKVAKSRAEETEGMVMHVLIQGWHSARTQEEVRRSEGWVDGWRMVARRRTLCTSSFGRRSKGEEVEFGSISAIGVGQRNEEW
jgi:hypothetical protein